MRATDIPASISCLIESADTVLGPSVHTILLRGRALTQSGRLTVKDLPAFVCGRIGPEYVFDAMMASFG